MSNILKEKNKIDIKKYIALATFTIALIGVALIWFWLTKNNMNMNEEIQPGIVTPPSAVSVTDSPTSTPAAELLNIPAWDVRLSIPVALQDTEIKYTERKSSDQPSSIYYVFTTSRIQALGAKCRTQPFGDTVILNRSAEKQLAAPDGELINENPIGGYYYVLSSPIAPCSGFDVSGKMQAPSQVEVNDRVDLNVLVKSIQAN